MSIAMANHRDVDLDNLAAELTNAVYPALLRYGAGNKWLDLELDLWKALADTLKRIDRSEGECLASCYAAPKTSKSLG